MEIYTCGKHNYTGVNAPCPDCLYATIALAADRDRWKAERDLLFKVANDMILFIGRVSDWYGPDPPDKEWRAAINKMKEEK